jgi:hypothetical protein
LPATTAGPSSGFLLHYTTLHYAHRPSLFALVFSCFRFFFHSPRPPSFPHLASELPEKQGKPPTGQGRSPSRREPFQLSSFLGFTDLRPWRASYPSASRWPGTAVSCFSSSCCSNHLCSLFPKFFPDISSGRLRVSWSCAARFLFFLPWTACPMPARCLGQLMDFVPA